jgi:alkanesulfonate monooxygenase SsuD/methylene tetrahydromethanopterin reductase-like flavin-dependent oxidoreductase (luciferase family)
VLIAGEGERYLLGVVAQRADWWLSYAHRPDVLRRKIGVLADHCRVLGRDPNEIRMATPLTVYLRSRLAEARRWAGDAVEREEPAFAGDPSALVDRITELASLGFQHIQLRFAGFPDIRDLRLFVDEVMPVFR